MTTYLLDILLHYFRRANDHRSMTDGTPIWNESIEGLESDGLIEKTSGPDRCYALTEKGHAYVNAILTMPLPIEVRKWVVPREAAYVYYPIVSPDRIDR